MDKIFSSIFLFLNDLSLKKVVFLIICICIIGIGLVYYERITDTNALRKIEASNVILESMEESQFLTKEQETQIQELRTTLLNQLENAFENDELSIIFQTKQITISTDRVLRFIFGGLLMFLSSIICFLKSIKRNDLKETAYGLAILAVLFGITGVCTPQTGWPWFHIFGIPIIVFSIIAILTVLLAYQQKAVKRKQKGQSQTKAKGNAGVT